VVVGLDVPIDAPEALLHGLLPVHVLQLHLVRALGDLVPFQLGLQVLHLLWVQLNLGLLGSVLQEVVVHVVVLLQEDSSLPSSPILLVPLVHQVALALALAGVRDVIVVAERYLVYVRDSLGALPRLHNFLLFTLLGLELLLDEMLALLLDPELHRVLPLLLKGRAVREHCLLFLLLHLLL